MKENTMRVIITGGTGLIGSALAKNLSKDGHEVIILSRQPEKYKGSLSANVLTTRWNAVDSDGWEHLANGVNAIVNLAGENLSSGRWNQEQKQRFRNSRLNAGEAIVDAVKKVSIKPGVIIQASAVGYYGPTGDEIIQEDNPPGQDFLAKLCLEWEASTAPVDEMGVRRAIIRTGIPLTTKGGVLPRFLLPSRLFVGGPLGTGDQWFPWLHIKDQVRAILFLIENKVLSGPFNLSAPYPVTNRQFAQNLGQVLNRPSFMRVPSLALKILFGEMATIILDGQRVVPKRLQEAGFEFLFKKVKPALRDLLDKKP
jgi:uncharacterized protein